MAQGIYDADGKIRLSFNDTTGTGIYAADGSIRATLANEGAQLYASDGSLNVYADGDYYSIVSNGLGIGRQQGGAAPPIWTPEALFASSEAGAWYDPSDLSSMYQGRTGTTAAVIGSPVGQLRDKSGNGNHMVAPFDSARPILRQTVGGKYYLQFDGIDDEMQASVAWVLTAQTTVAAFRYSGANTYQRVFTQWPTGVDDYAATGHYIPVLRNVGLNSFASFANNSPRSIIALSPDTDVVFSSNHSGSQISNRANGGTATTYTHSLNLTVDRANIGLATGIFTGYVFGLIVVNKSLAPSDLANAEQYLAARSGVTY